MSYSLATCMLWVRLCVVGQSSLNAWYTHCKTCQRACIAGMYNLSVNSRQATSHHSTLDFHGCTYISCIIVPTTCGNMTTEQQKLQQQNNRNCNNVLTMFSQCRGNVILLDKSQTLRLCDGMLLDKLASMRYT
jgi:hypothetical protein